MTKVMKKKIKIKKKNFTIFAIINIIIIFSIYKLITNIINKQEKSSTNEQSYKYKKLDNINTKIDYFNNNYLDRYIKYKQKNKNLTNIQIIKNVNMQLDQKPYKNTSPAKNIGNEKILVNKHYYLEKDYIPENLENIDSQYALANMKLTSVAKRAFEKLAKDAKKDNMSIIAMSTYRSYSYQEKLYNNYVKSDGKEKADTYSGRPGYSEHQTGLAVDVYNRKKEYTDFEMTKEFDWMQKNAYKYGFILRFPKNKENETGYMYESWHYRYVGLDIAKYIHENNITLEEYHATKVKD